jgi:hypothetical protein
MQTPLHKIGFVKHWNWVHWLGIAAIVAVSVKEVYQNQVERLSALDTQNVEVIEENIQEYNTMAERLAQLEVLPPVEQQWQYVPAIAARYGVGLNILGAKSSDMYSGPLQAWHGELDGRVGSVLVAAVEIQRTVPTYLYKISINNGTAKLGFSVLGSE